MLLIDAYRSRKDELGLPTLDLSSLRLGFGFLPTKSARAHEAGPSPPLSDLANISCMTELQIDNWNASPGDEYVPFELIDEDIFSEATSLNSLIVERYSRDMVALTKKLAPFGKLDQLEVTRYFETLESNDPPFELSLDVQGEAIYSEPFFNTGCRWRKLSYGTKLAHDRGHRSTYHLRNFWYDCSFLEEFSLPMREEDIKIFKAEIMPKAKKLGTLMITGGFIEQHEFLQPSYSRYSQMSKAEQYDDDGREYEENMREYEQQRVILVKELFQINRRLKKQDSGFKPLKYVGLVDMVYCCMLQPLGEPITSTSFSLESLDLSEGISAGDNYQIVKLAPDQARGFGMVRRLYPDKDFWF